MSFKDRLREKRLEANLTQVQLAEKVSISARTIQNYELGTRKPTKYEVVEKLATVLDTTPEYLLGQSGMLVVAAHEKGGSKAARDIDELVSYDGTFADQIQCNPVLICESPVIADKPPASGIIRNCEINFPLGHQNGCA